MEIQRRKIDGEVFHVPEEIVKQHVERLKDELLVKRDAPDRKQITTRVKLKAEAKSAWANVKEAASNALKPVWDKKEDIIITIATKLIQGWIERKLNQHSK